MSELRDLLCYNIEDTLPRRLMSAQGMTSKNQIAFLTSSKAD